MNWQTRRLHLVAEPKLKSPVGEWIKGKHRFSLSRRGDFYIQRGSKVVFIRPGDFQNRTAVKATVQALAVATPAANCQTAVTRRQGGVSRRNDERLSYEARTTYKYVCRLHKAQRPCKQLPAIPVRATRLAHRSGIWRKLKITKNNLLLSLPAKFTRE